MNIEKTLKCKICNSVNVKFEIESNNTHGRHKVDSSESYKIFRCDTCEVLFLNSIKTDDGYYEKNYNQIDYYQTKDSKKIFMRLLEKVLFIFSSSIKKYLIKTNLKKINKNISLLDFGCGDGEFLSSLNSNKYEVYGHDRNSTSKELCKKRGISIYNDGDKKNFDVITMWHVIEHINDPIEVLKKLNAILKDNGVIVLQTPNTHSWGFKFGASNWFHLDSPRHLFLFNKKSIDHMCKDTGFILKKVYNEFYDYPLDLFWSLRKYRMMDTLEMMKYKNF